MSKKTFLQFGVMVLLVAIAAGSAQSNYPSSSSSNRSYPEYTCPVPTPSSSSSSTIQKMDFPDPVCQSCKGRKGYYLLDIWYTCRRCSGTGREPKH